MLMFLFDLMCLDIGSGDDMLILKARLLSAD
jgi:hypothetical protein